MSLPVEQLDTKTLNRLDLPKTAESPVGLDRLWLQKLINLVYITNDISKTPHKFDVRAASDRGAAGARFTAPVDARRIIFSVRARLVTTATAGGRTIVVERRNKALDLANQFVSETVAASTTRNYEISMSNSSSAEVHRQITYPIILEPEWFLVHDGDIDDGDDVSWVIDYVEIPI